MEKIYGQSSRKYALLITGDIFILTVLISAVIKIKYGIIDAPLGISIVFSVFSYIFIFYIIGLYTLEEKFNSILYLSRLLAASLLTTLVMASTYYFIFSGWKLSRLSFFINIPLIIAFTFLWRLIFARVFKYAGRVRRIIIVGAGRSGKVVYNTIKKNPEFNVVGFIDDDPEKANKIFGSQAVIGNCSQIYSLAKKNNIDTIMLAIRDKKSSELYNNMLKCKMAGMTVTDMGTVYEEATGRVPIEYVKDSWFLYSPILGVKKNIYNQRIKRILDIVFSSLGLLLSLPLITFVPLLIKLDSKGPVFFKQKRLGMNEKLFSIYKFRSMYVDAELNGAVWAQKQDTRVTRIGKIIRHFRIDEIPQMWNVLKGDMSFIGPRPERPEFIKELKGKISYYSLRHFIKPGITGWAQVNYPYGASVRDASKKLQYDLYYIRNASFLLDLFILVKTVRIVILRIGSR